MSKQFIKNGCLFQINIDVQYQNVIYLRYVNDTIMYILMFLTIFFVNDKLYSWRVIHPEDQQSGITPYNIVLISF